MKFYKIDIFGIKISWENFILLSTKQILTEFNLILFKNSDTTNIIYITLNITKLENVGCKMKFLLKKIQFWIIQRI